MATESSPETSENLEYYFDQLYEVAIDALERVLKLVRETDP